MSDTLTHQKYYVSSPTEDDYFIQDNKLLRYGKELSSTTPRNISSMDTNKEYFDGGPNSFKYIEGRLFSTKEVEFRKYDVPMTDESFFASIKGRPLLVHNVLRFNRKHNIRSFDFILSYTQLNRWAAKVYKPVAITKYYKGSFIFTGCSFIFNEETNEYYPLELHARYELIGDSLGEDDSLDESGGSKSGPKINFTYTYDAQYIYVYISGVSPYRLAPVEPGHLEDISAGDNEGSFTYEVKRPNLVEVDHLNGISIQTEYERDAVTYCDITISLKETIIATSEPHSISFIPISEIDIRELNVNNKTLLLAPPRNGSIAIVGMELASDIGKEITSDIHPLRFGSRAFTLDRPKIEAISDKIEKKIKEYALLADKIPFTITEDVRFHGKYNIINDYFIDNAADSFGSYLIKEVGYYDVINDTFNITNYFFDFDNDTNLKKVGDLRSYLRNDHNVVPPTSKTNRPLAIMKSFEFVPSINDDRYDQVTYISSNLETLVTKVSIELANNAIPHDFDKIIYFCYNDKEISTSYDIYDHITVPYIAICDFRDYDMQYVIKKNIFTQDNTFNRKHITCIASYVNEDYPYSKLYLLGTSEGVYLEVYLDEDFNPVINESFHNPFLQNGNDIDDSKIGNEPIVDIRVDEYYIYFIGQTQFALYSLEEKKYIPINQNDYRSTLKGAKLLYVKRLDETSVIFGTDAGIFVYNIDSSTFTSNRVNRINNKYYIDYADNYASDYSNIQYNFNVDHLIDASVIQVGQFVYLIGARMPATPSCQKLNILNGEITDISDTSSIYNTPNLCSNGTSIFAIGGRTNEESGGIPVFKNYITPFSAYNVLNDTWSPIDLLQLKNAALGGVDDEIRLGNVRPVIAQNDNILYLFHPELVKIDGDNNIKSYNNKGIKITLNDDNTIDSIDYFDITLADENQSNIFSFTSDLTWLPLKWNKDECEFITINRTTDSGSNTCYQYILFKITYSNYKLEIIYDTIFYFSGDDNLSSPYDALKNAKIYSDKDKYIHLIFCRNEFLLHLSYDGGFGSSYTLDGDFIDYNVYNKFWKGGEGGRKYPDNTYLIHKDNYLIFAGGEGYRNADYFDLNQFHFMETPRYSIIENQVLKATEELLKVPSEVCTLGSISSCTFNSDIYIAASIVIDGSALNNYSELTQPEGAPVLFLFKIDSKNSNKGIVLVKDLSLLLTGGKKISFIDIYSVGKHLYISLGRISYYDRDTHGFTIHQNVTNWTDVFAYDSVKNTIINCSANIDNQSESIGLFPLIFNYSKNHTIICKDEIVSEQYPLMDMDREGYAIGIQSSYEDPIDSRWIKNDNKLILASEDELPFKYASSASYGHYGFIVTPITIEIIDLDSLVVGYDNPEDRVIHSSIVYRFASIDEGLFKDAFIHGNYLYITGGLHTTSIQNTSAKGVNNRVLRFDVHSIIETFSSLNEYEPIVQYHGIPEVLQLETPTIKYLSAYGVMPNNSFITTGDIFFLNETESSYSGEREPFDAVISFQKHTYPECDKSFIKNNIVYTIEKLPFSSTNQHDYNFHPFTLNDKDYILVYGKNSVDGYVDLYDVEKHIWIDVPPLPVVVTNISFMNNMIIGGTLIMGDLSVYPDLTIQILNLDSTGTQWEWITENYGSHYGNLQTYNALSCIITNPENLESEYFIVGKTSDGNLYWQENNQEIIIQLNQNSDSTYTKLPNIPISSLHTYKVIGCHIIKEGSQKYYIVLLYRNDNKTLNIVSYHNNAWSFLLGDFIWDELINEPNSYTFKAIDNHLELLYTLRDSVNNTTLIGRLTWDFSNGILSNKHIETYGEFNHLNENSIISGSIKSGNLYFKNEDDSMYYVPKDNLSLDASYSKSLKQQYPFIKAVENALEIKQFIIKDKGLIATFFTKNSAIENRKDYFCTLYNIHSMEQTKVLQIYSAATIFDNNAQIPFEIISCPDVLHNHFSQSVDDSSLLLITHYNDEQIIFKVAIPPISSFDTKPYIEINALFKLRKQSTDEVSDPSIPIRHCFDNTEGITLFELASYNEDYSRLYKADLNWSELLDESSSYPETIYMQETDNIFDGLEDAANIDMTVTKNNDVVILLDQVYGGSPGEYQQRTNRLYKASIQDIGVISKCFEIYELPLSIGEVSLVNPFEENDDLYIVPRINKSKQPIIKWNNGSSYYISMNSISYNDIDLQSNWVYYQNSLYNPVYDCVTPLSTIGEQKLPVAVDIGKYANFTVYKDSIYLLRGVTEDSEMQYYLDVIDSVTFEKIRSSQIVKGTSIPGNLDIPLKASLVSMNPSGTEIIIAGGLLKEDVKNLKVYSIDVETSVIELFYTDNIDIGSYASYYKNKIDKALCIFPKNNSTMVVLPYDNETPPTIMQYDENVRIKHVLMRGLENKLIVIGRVKTKQNILFAIDLYNTSISNYKDSGIITPIKAVITNIEKPLIYTEEPSGLSKVYQYNEEDHEVINLENDLATVLNRGHIKLEYSNEENDILGLDITNTLEDEVFIYRFKYVHPHSITNTKKVIPYTLGNQIKKTNHYNSFSPFVLIDLYDYRIVNNVSIKYDKVNNRIKLFDKDFLYIDCDELLWAAPFYSNIVLAVVLGNNTYIHYIDAGTKTNISTTDVTSNENLHKRKTLEAAFVYNTTGVIEPGTKAGTIYLAGGESDTDIFQNFVEINFKDNDGTTDIVVNNFISSADVGVYKSKILSLSDIEVIVISGLTYKSVGGVVVARIPKSSLSSYIKSETTQVYYVTPYFGNSSFIIQRDFEVIDNKGVNFAPTGEIKEAFVLSNHVYFIAKNNLYVAEIDNLKRLSGIIPFVTNNNDSIEPYQEIFKTYSENKYRVELNNQNTTMVNYTSSSYFNSLFNYYLDAQTSQSRIKEFLNHTFQMDLYEKVTIPDSISLFDVYTYSDSFNIGIKKVYSNIDVKEYTDDVNFTIKHVDYLTVFSFIWGTTYKIYIAYSLSGDFVLENFNKSLYFEYSYGLHELEQNDTSLFANTWQACITNGTYSERRLDIVLTRDEYGNPSIYSITGDDPRFPFPAYSDDYGILPIVLGYGEMPDTIFDYRYLLFIDSVGNVVTFDKVKEDFISPEGLEDIITPYLSGELVVFPSKMTERGSIGKRVWGYHDNNPYAIEAVSDDKVSITSNDLIE